MISRVVCEPNVMCGLLLHSKTFLNEFALVRSRHVSGLFARHMWPLALMVSADQVPYSFADNMVSQTFDGVSWLAG